MLKTYDEGTGEKMINGERVCLVPISLNDTENIIRWRNSEDVKKYFIYQELFTKESHEQRLKEQVFAGKCKQYIIYMKNDMRPIGSVYLRDIDNKNKKAEYGIFIGEVDYRGRGIGTEAARLIVRYAFNNLKLHKIMLRVIATNLTAINSYKRAGFVKEAYLKDEVIIDSEYKDIVYMAIINLKEIRETI